MRDTTSTTVEAAAAWAREDAVPCSFPGCGRPQRANSLCRTHREQQRKGRPLTPIRFYVPNNSSIAYRLAVGTVVADSGCWIWTRTLTAQGYGQLRVHNGTLSAHRASYELHVGPIPEGLDLDHLCRVRNCINPAHLEPVTPAENARRAVAVRPVQTHCKRGHEWSPENTGWIGTTGWRFCRACARDWQRQRPPRTAEQNAARRAKRRALQQVAS